MNSHPTVSEQLAEFIHATSFDSLPPAIVEKAKSRVLDSLATAIASRSLPVPGVALKFVEKNHGEATIFGHSQRVPAVDAALVNGTLINGTTHDDFLYKSHPGAVVIPAGIAIAEEEGSSGQELLTSVVLGYDLVARAYIGGPAMLPKFRASGVAGAVGGAATAGKLQKLGIPELVNALGLSTMFASGFGEGFLTGTMDVKLNVGWACRSGVSASKLARLGATSSPRAFEGKSGFFNAFAGTAEKASEAARNLGEPFLIERVTYKERPICIFVQTPVHLAHTFAQEKKLDPAKIQRVTIQAPEATYTNPGFQNIAPFGTPLQARISARFCTAAALLGKPIDQYGFYANTIEPEVLTLAGRIDLLEPAEDTERVYLEILYDGVVHRLTGVEMETMLPTTAKVVAKFKRLTGDFFGKRLDQVLEMILNLDRVTEVRELSDLLRATAA
jgi:2-methylcitrate dehydratase PrpD